MARVVPVVAVLSAEGVAVKVDRASEDDLVPAASMPDTDWPETVPADLGLDAMRNKRRTTAKGRPFFTHVLVPEAGEGAFGELEAGELEAGELEAGEPPDGIVVVSFVRDFMVG